MAKAGPAGAGTRVARPGAPGVALISVFAVVAIAVAGLAEAGAWWAPFVAGVYAGRASLRWRRVVLVTVAGCVVGWVLPLWILALLGYPSGATARAIAAFAGLPPYAAVIIVVTLLLAAAQALAGAWLARAVGRAVAPATRP
ncbi:MAG TPA: hypothetical protein VHZ03_47510 [Trebonia sp.]|jgi:hypothetical protein|nr:hypothetical protein [Trebonia sp.]